MNQLTIRSKNRNPSENEIFGLDFLKVSESLFDDLSNVVFFIKDREARYLSVNQTLVHRCDVRDKSFIIGKTALELFPSPLGRRYYEEDQRVINNGDILRDLLELHLYMRGGPGWCITTKHPLRNNSGEIVGVAGVSYDIHSPATEESGYHELAEAVNYIQRHFDETIRIDELANICRLSVYQFEQRTKKLFQITVGQFINKTRIDAARHRLASENTPIAEIALDCGFSDQSAFTRQFKSTTGLTPSEYRKSKL